MNDNFVVYIIETVIIALFFPVIGRLLDYLYDVIINFLSHYFSWNIVYKIFNKWTFVGVVQHECAHALFAILTGAKIVEFVPFGRAVNEYGEKSLGHVKYVTRGPYILNRVQDTFVSFAPTLVNLCIVYLGLVYWDSPIFVNNYIYRVLLAYYMFSCFVHASMSNADLRLYSRGMHFLVFVIFGICFVLDKYFGFTFI